MASAGLAATLQRFIAERVGDGVQVSNLRTLAGGASHDIYAFDLRESAARAPRRLVLRLDPPVSPVADRRVDEYAVLSVAHDAGVTVPRVYWHGCDDDGLGAGFVIMDYVDGEAIARHLLREDRYAAARAALPAQLARELARIHAIDLDDPRLAWLHEPPQREGEGGSALAVLDRYRRLLAAAAQAHPQPVLELVARWLELNAAPQSRRTLVHGDFRVGNMLFDECGLTSVLDWELVHVGDPLEDIGWLSVRAWRFGADHNPVGGLCSRREFWSLYEQESGYVVEPAAARYWEIFGNWTWAAICILQAARRDAGSYPDVELAAIGRRVAEVEQELLTLLEEACNNAG